MVQLDLHPSRYLLAIILLTHIAVMLLLLQIPLQWWAILLIEICILGSFIYSIYHYILRRKPNDIIKVWLDTNKHWHILTRDQHQYQVKLLGDSVNSNYLIILNVRIKTNSQKKSILIFNDAVDKRSFYRLRMILNTRSY